MDLGGTAKKIQRATKVAEESYKKMNEMMERIQRLQTDLETTSEQVDHIEYDLAEQRALLEAMAEDQGLDIEEILMDADLPEPPVATDETDETDVTDETDEDLAQRATSRPSASDDQ